MNDLVKMALGVGVAACAGAVVMSRLLAPGQPAAGMIAPRAAPTERAFESVSPSLKPQRAMGAGPVMLSADARGHYHAQVEILGRRVPMLVDTGASIVALTQEDAAAFGVHVSPGDYTVALATASGMAKGAPATLREMRVEGILARDVEAVVLPRGVAGRSLLGMSFLRTLRGFEIADGRLVLRP